MQKEAIALDQKKQILGAVIPGEEIAAMTPEEVNTYYGSHISSTVVDVNGEEVAGATAQGVDVAKNYKKPVEERQFPVYIFPRRR